MKIRRFPVALCSLAFFAVVLLLACSPARRAPARPGPNVPGRPNDRPRNEPMDTVRWSDANRPKPPIGNNPRQGDETRPGGDGSTYQIALLLPFLGNQFDGTTVPEKSTLALQFYGGAQLALKKISQEDGLNLVVDLYDTQAADADFQKVMTNSRFDKANVYIGPIRSSHVSLMAERARQNRKIMISPESPNADLTTQNPGFLQSNPSLRAHCEAITRFVRRSHKPEEVVLVCKQKESERLLYFQNANAGLGGGHFAELIVPDATVNFDNINLAGYLKAGRSTAFIMPSWAGQDFVMAFMRKLRAAKGSARVEVYGMPQWLAYDNIDPDFYAALNVHLSSASFIDYSSPDVQEFQQQFYDAYGTLPNDDAFNGYDVALFTGKMLRKYGLSFPEKLAREPFQGMRSRFQFSPVFAEGHPDDGRNQYDYLENKFVYILQYENGQFIPAE